MASVDGTIPLPSGFKYEFLTPVDEDFICQICHLPLKQAVLTRCGHRFCNECLTEFLRRKQNPECPCDREKIDEEKDIFPDRASQRRVLSYMVKCPSDGCQWTGQLCDVERHEGNCVYKIIECINQHCNVRVPRGSLDEHLRASCLWRIVHCPHCSQSHPKSEEDLHNEVCLMLPLNCACHQIFPRGEMQNHKETECILTLLPCPYLELGCTAKVERQNLEKHLLDQTSSHLSLACKKLVNFRKEFDDEKAKFEKQIDDLKKDYDSLVLKLSAQEKGTSNPKMETPTFVWKLSAFSEMLREAKRGRNVKIHSTPFYTAPFGYKLKLYVKPNGDGSGKNTHLSVFVIIMKGEYDGMLLWPFNQKVSLTLIDQQESSDERENIVMHFRATNNTENFMRPVSDENTGRGFSRFVSHEKLIKTRKFIVDDTLFIQVYVGPL